jgi:hypothetical protein
VIGRLWHGWTTPERADDYQRLLETEVLPGIEANTRGYEGVFVLRRDDGDRVEFVTLTLWQSLDAVRSLVGDDYEMAYVPEEAQQLLDRFDKQSLHYDVVVREH